MADLGNFATDEGTLFAEQEKTITLDWYAYRTVITNDSATNDIMFTITGNTGTLKPTETISMDIRLTALTLEGDGQYRVWLYG